MRLMWPFKCWSQDIPGSIPELLMPWFLALPSHQQLLCWLCEMGIFRGTLNCNVACFEKRQKIQKVFFMFPHTHKISMLSEICIQTHRLSLKKTHLKLLSSTFSRACSSFTVLTPGLTSLAVHFTNDFSNVIQIWWKFHWFFFQIPMK